MHRPSKLLAAILPLCAMAVPARAKAQELDEPVRYDRDVRPLLADRCFRCHGPDAAAREADLRLDSFAQATERRDGDGRPAIVPGDPEASELWHRIRAGAPDADAMPPRRSGKPRLSAAEAGLLRRWIEQGAGYEPHWSFVPPQRPAVPQVRHQDRVRTPVDAFVFAALERRGIAPHAEADPGTLLRRLFLTLTGLPPEPEELAAFERDPSTAAYDRLVERLLTEEPYRSRHAERMAVPWLDAARYADTSGIHMDAGRQIWPFRDYVLASFRDNKPFDRFVVEQLAGDLLEGATLEQQVASGFHRNHVTTDEGGAIAEEYLVEYAVDRTATTGAVFLGLTLGCARCHEHKFDPISHEDFYRLYAYFDSIDEPGLYTQEKDPNRAFEPFLAVPSPQQSQERAQLAAALALAQAELAAMPEDEAAEAASFTAAVQQRAGIEWADAAVVAAASRHGAALTPQADGSVLASGANPAQDVHVLRLRTEATGLRLLCLEALPDRTLGQGRVGRGPNGNAVLQAISVVATAVADPTRRVEVPLVWAWADVEQQNGDFAVIRALRADDGAGWAVDAHSRPPGPRTALFLAEAPFGFDGGTELEVTLDYTSIYAQHVFGRVRLSVGAIATAGIDLLPDAVGGWFHAGPFAAGSPQEAWDAVHGPEQQHTLRRESAFPAGTGQRRWSFRADFAEGRVLELEAGRNVHYVAREVLAPATRRRGLSLGSDDGFRLFVGGAEVAARQVERGAAADQDRAEVEFAPGGQLLVLKVVNTGGNAACYLQRLPREGELDGALVAALLPDRARVPLEGALLQAWRLRFSPGYAERRQRAADLERQLAEFDRAVPRTMVMRERQQRRPTYVLQRGEYDKPDRNRPVARGVPAALGKLPDGAPDDRRGLAQWIVAADNPLFHRVQVNRLFELVFGTGIVRTSEDFGMQGEWPSHPGLLDWLAVEFRDSGHDVQHVLRLLVRSATFRQQNRQRPEVRERDPDNRLLSWFPRRRLWAEALRDQALFAGGILVERFGGPSVKPYQPAGLWQEVAMVQSNTRVYERGKGDELFRRSLYTYHKRACPPPSMLAFDAPTREFCTVRRLPTNTPLQALVLWNDEQFVEAARALAERVLLARGDDHDRLDELFVRCTSRKPDGEARTRCLELLMRCRDRFAAAPEDATALLAVGTRPRAELAPAELASWTLLASTVLNLDAALCIP